jgi:hypothetical protein
VVSAGLDVLAIVSDPAGRCCNRASTSGGGRGAVEVAVGMMVTARRLAEGDDEIRYEFGLDRQFDRVLGSINRTGKSALMTAISTRPRE